MPTRRPSAVAVPISTAGSTGSSRVHKSNDSHHILPGLSTSQQHSLLSLGAAATPQQKVVQVLVNRLKNKLPCNSGVPLDRLEADSAIQQTIEALVDLSYDSIDVIGWHLSELLDRLAKQTDTNGHPSIEVLQSQLFVLKVLSMTLASRWTQPRSSSRASSHTTPAGSDSSVHNLQTKRSRLPPSDSSVPPPSWQDFVPLDDSCARYLLSVMILFLRQTSPPEFPLMLATRFSDLTFRDYESMGTPTYADMPDTAGIPLSADHEAVLRSQASSNSVRSGSGKMSIHSSIHLSGAKVTYEKTHMSLLKSSFPVNNLIAKYAGRIVFHISATNWNVVYQRLRSKIHFFASHSADNPDVIDLHLMAHSALDRTRLFQLLSELSSLLVSMGRESQVAIAVPLRSAVWNWIINFPTEFNEVIRTRGKAEGASERVFDLLYKMSLNGEERVFWPTLTILSCTTPDRLSAAFAFSYGPTKSSRKDIKFGEDLVKHATGASKFSDVALVCLLDICRAATHVRPDGEVPLRMVAFDVAHEIKSALWSSATRQPFWDSPDEIDVSMYAEALVAVFRFLPEDDSIPLFSVCLEPERSDAVKTCAVRACLTLAQEAGRIKSQRSLKRLEDVMAIRLRSIFKTAGLRRHELDLVGNIKRSATRPKAARIVPQSLSDREVLLLGILSLWRAHPMFHLKNMLPSELDEWATISVRIWEAPLDVSIKVSKASSFRIYTDALLNSPLDPDDPFFPLMISFAKKTLPPAILSIATNILNTRVDVEAQRMWVAIAHQFLEFYTKKTRNPHVKEIQMDPARVPGFALAEIGFLVALTCVDSNISQQAAKGLRLLSHAERQPDVPVNPTVTDEDRSKRNPIYEQLGDPKVVVVGRVVHQKRIRKLVRLISYSSAVHVAVWQECFWRWRALSEAICESSPEMIESTDATSPTPTWQQEQQRYQWQNLTLFLAALGGACVLDNQDLNSLSDVIPMQALPDNLRVTQNPSNLIGSFIVRLTNCLVTADTQMRDVARDALGLELSPRLYAKLLKHLDETIRSIEQGAGTDLTDALILLPDQFIAVLRLLVDNTTVVLEDVSIDISSTLLTLASFISRFHGLPSYRLKSRFCAMCESACGRTDSLTLRKDSSARRSILDIIMEWIHPSDDQDSDMLAAHNELNMACLRTCVKLLDRLHLRDLDNSNTGDDSLHVVSRLFNKYSSTLLHGLESCHIDIAASDSVSDLGSIHQKMRLAQREAEIRELIITGLSHLVSANTETGFKQCLPLAYDKDNRKRAIFAHVFARVLGQGAKFDPQPDTTKVARHTQVCELVKSSDMILALTICEVCPPSEVEAMISVLLNLFDTRASLMRLIKYMIEREVAQTDNEASLFRSNSTCTRFLSVFARIHGYNYLRSLIQPLVKNMVDMPPGRGYDLDPNKVSEEEAKNNQRSVELIASSFLEIVISSIPAVPDMFREICAHISKTVVQVWPDSKFAAIGAFIFLRFISPAVVSPDIVDIELPEENAITLRRGLMVIAKIIQNLANNIFFGKEAHMTVLNTFLKENITNVTRFLSELSKPAHVADNDNDQWLGNTADDTDIIILHRFFDKHADKIGKELLSLTKPMNEGDVTAISGKRAWDGLCALLVDLGSPTEVPRLSSFSSEEHQDYLDIMARYSRRDTESVQRLFVETNVPSGYAAVFILRLSKIDVEALDTGLLMYHIFKTLELPAYDNRPFEIIVDCTSFTSTSEVPIQWLKYCVELIPSDIRSRFMTLYILNPNALAFKYLRRLYYATAGVSICSNVVAYSSVSELMEHIPHSVLPFLEYPVFLEQEPKEVFTEVSIKSPIRPIVLQVRTTHVRVTSIKRQFISPGFPCRITEIIPLADISDTYNIATGAEPNEFIVRKTQQGVTVHFLSPIRDSIVKCIRAAKGRLKEQTVHLSERLFRFSNVPATLLHIGFLSIDLNDDELRGAAYNLLGAVLRYLKYDNSPIIAPTAGFVPGDVSAFVIQLSQRLADFAPRLTLDFLSEVSVAMSGMDSMGQRISCIHYMNPWIKNLGLFTDATSPFYERSGARLREFTRVLSELSATYSEIASTMQKYIWVEMSKLDSSVLDVVLDELVRAATDAGIGTTRCEAISQIVASLSSIIIRGRIYSKLRKALSKAFPQVSNNSLQEHPSWPEICTLIRLALVVSSPSSGQLSANQLYMSEIVHLVTLTAASGPSLVRKSVYGIVMNLLQSLVVSCGDESMCPELLQLIDDCMSPENVRLFGLRRESPTSEYINADSNGDKEFLDNHERLVQLMVRIMEVTSGSKGLLNVWRARWMSLVASTAFQVSPAVQTRSFSALGSLATAEVDEDFLYQILVALNTALSNANESQTTSIVSMLRCICKVVPALPKDTRYLCLLFWLAVSLLQSSYSAFYIEATRMVCVTLENMERRKTFHKNSVPSVLLKSREPLEQITSQLDDILKVSFESNFSFSLAAIIFKGLRHSSLRDSAEAVLRTLLCVTVRAQPNRDVPNGFRDGITMDALGYFLALLPLSATRESYRRLLSDCMIDDAWLPDAGLPDDDDEHRIPRIPPSFLGINDSSTALLVTTFVGTMLGTAQGDDAETEILYNLVSDIGNQFPDIVAMAYDGLQDRIKDSFANSSNPAIIRAVSNILRISVLDGSTRVGSRGSASTLSTVDENVHGPGRNHINALEELKMQGLANSFQFLPRGHATKMINWIPELVALFIA